MNLLERSRVELTPEVRSEVFEIVYRESDKKIAEEFKKACHEVVANRPRSRPLNIEESLINRLTAGAFIIFYYDV